MTQAHIDACLAPDAVEAVYPLAPEQRGLWYLQQLAPDCGAYHLLFSVAVSVGEQGWPPALPAILDTLMARYPVLRTSLPATPDGAQQRVHAHVAPDVRSVDASGWSDDHLREQMRSDSRAPFDLARPPLWRVHLYRRSDSSWVAALVAHHVLLDFWSLGLLLQEVGARLGVTAEPSMQVVGDGYGDYAARQQARQADPAVQGRWLQYWHEQLHDAPAVHSLALDAVRPKLQHYDGRSLPFAFDAATSDIIRRTAREQGVTNFILFVTAYCVMLARFSGADDLVVATPVAGRTERSQRMQLGQFVNTVALRVRLADGASFECLLGQVRETVVGALRHQDCPFAWLVEELAPRRDPSHAPIAQLGFSWERLPLLAEFEQFFLAEPPPMHLEAAGLTLSPFAVPQQEGQLDLTLEMGGERDGAFVGVFKYQHHLLHEATVREMMACFVNLTAQLCANPSLPLDQVMLADPAARLRWLALGDGPRHAWPLVAGAPARGNTVLDDLAARVAATPDATALCDAGTRLSYADLWQRAGQIAAELQACGVAPESRVGLMLERSADLVTGIVGIWRAGAAYVPLDPGFPAERLAYIADDAQLSALLTEHAVEALWPPGLPAVCVDDPLPAAIPDAARMRCETAYILYTSGSTGLPKGVRVGHHSVHNFLHGMQQLLSWDQDCMLLAVTTPGFDISVLEMLLPLLAGGSVYIADGAATRDGVKLAALLNGQPITALQATPATWNMLIDAGWSGDDSLVALCGGESLAPELADKLHARSGALWNVYGPTETTVWSSAVRLQKGEAIHIGQPIANTQFYVLDPAGHPVPPGMLGELWIGGDGLALDYWRRPELSAEKFRTLDTLPNAGRLYRTGDQVRWTSEGRLAHHGRLDFQVKLRGFRIELGEIESVLRQQEGVTDVVVVVREDRANDARLVAYLVLAEKAPEMARLRDALRVALPAYMMPSAFVVLGALPQTPNRKIDRKALPAPDHTVCDENFIAPRDALEIQLAGLFSELLGMARIGVTDNFFENGGHSLLAVRLVAMIKRQFDIELSIAELLQHATVDALAARLRAGGDAKPGMLLTLRAGAEVQPLWLFHPIGGTVFCYMEMTRQLSAQRPVLALQAPGLDEEGEAEVTIEAMATRYLTVLRQKQPHGPYLLGGWCFGGAIAFEMGRQLRDAGETVDGIVLVDTRAPIPANVPSDADDATLLSWFARDLATPYNKVLTIAPETLRALPPEAMFAYVLDAAKAIDALPQDADADQLARYFEVYIGNAIALQMYFPPAETLPVMLLRAVDEPEDYGPTLGWSELAGAHLTMVDLPGTHNSIMYAPQADAVAATIEQHFPIQHLAGFST
jgi:amino acid adenylation domain-containing protein